MTAAENGGAEWFPSTRWSLVARAGQIDPESRREALGELLGRYLPALRAHLIHHKRLAPEKADDLVQEFITSKILEKDLIARADQPHDRQAVWQCYEEVRRVAGSTGKTGPLSRAGRADRKHGRWRRHERRGR